MLGLYFSFVRRNSPSERSGGHEGWQQLCLPDRHLPWGRRMLVGCPGPRFQPALQSKTPKEVTPYLVIICSCENKSCLKSPLHYAGSSWRINSLAQWHFGLSRGSVWAQLLLDMWYLSSLIKDRTPHALHYKSRFLIIGPPGSHIAFKKDSRMKHITFHIAQALPLMAGVR